MARACVDVEVEVEVEVEGGGLYLCEAPLQRGWEGSGDKLCTVGVCASDPAHSVR